MIGDRLQSLGRAHRVAVAHRPQGSHRAAESIGERRAEIGEAVDLAILRLADAAVDGCEVVAVDRRRAGGDRAGWPLSMVVLVSGDAMLRGDRRAGRLQRVELGRDLEQRALVFRRAVQLADVALDNAELEPAARGVGHRRAFAQRLQRSDLKFADRPAFAVDLGVEAASPTESFARVSS